jgi:hypothetical protein
MLGGGNPRFIGWLEIPFRHDVWLRTLPCPHRLVDVVLGGRRIVRGLDCLEHGQLVAEDLAGGDLAPNALTAHSTGEEDTPHPSRWHTGTLAERTPSSPRQPPHTREVASSLGTEELQPVSLSSRTSRLLHLDVESLAPAGLCPQLALEPSGFPRIELTAPEGVRISERAFLGQKVQTSARPPLDRMELVVRWQW